MTDPKNTEDQKLSLDQLKDAAGGDAFMKLGDIKGESFHGNAAGDPLPTEEVLDKSSTKYNPGKGASYNPGQGASLNVNGTIGYE